MPRKVFFSFHYDDVLRVNVVRHSDTITRKYTGISRFTDRSLWETAKSQGPTAIKRLINPQLEYTSVTCVLIGQETWQRPWVRYELLKSLARGNGIFGVRIHDVGPRKTTPKNPFSGLLDTYELPKKVPLNPFDYSNALLAPHKPPVPSILAALLDEPPPSPLNQFDYSNALLAPYKPPAPSIVAALLDEPPPSPPGRNPLEYVGYTINRLSNRIAFHELDPFGWVQSEHVDAVSLTGLGHLSHTDSANLSQIFPVYDWKADNGYLCIDDWIEEAARRAGRR